MKKTMTTLTALLLTLSGCTSLSGGKTFRADAVWLAADQVYVVHDEEAGKEVWRRDGDEETFVARGTDIPASCGSVDFLFRVGDGRLGIALECDDAERLVAYTPATGTYQTLFDAPAAAEVAMQPGGKGGYVSTGLNGCWKLAVFGQASAESLAPTARFTCEQGGSAKAPRLLPNGDLLFIATDAKPPLGDDNRTWHLYLLTPGESAVRPIGPDLVGFPEVDVTPDGKTAIVALAAKNNGSLLAVDLANGDSRRLAEAGDWLSSPTVSPSGDQVKYIYDLTKIETVKLVK